MKRKKLLAMLAAAVLVAAMPAAAYAQPDAAGETSVARQPSLLDCVDFSDYETAFDLGQTEKETDGGQTAQYDGVAYFGNQEIELEGRTLEVGAASVEQHPAGFAASEDGCSGGSHRGKVYDSPVTVTRAHAQAEAHPSTCMVVYTRYWHCTECGTIGREEATHGIWCESAETGGDPALPTAETVG